jgi:hypothetical protein
MQQVISELEGLRRRSWRMLVLQRAAVLISWTIAVMLGLILFDYALRLPSAARLVLLLGGLGALGYGFWVYLRPSLMFQPSLTQVALRVERVLPSVAGRLASSVEFAAAGIDQSNELAARSIRETQTRLMGESVGAVIASQRTWRDVGIMLAIVAAACTLGIVNPTAASTGVMRLLMPLSDAKWPARTGVESLMDRVLVAGTVHPRGTALPLRAKITRGPDDQTVDAYIRMRIEGEYQPWQRIVLTHQGGGLHERLIDTNAEQMQLYFVTDDDETALKVIELVPPPSVRRASLTVEPPAYAKGRVPVYQVELGQGLDERAVTDTASLMGSHIDLTLELNKPLPVESGDAQASWLTSTFGWGEGELPQFNVDDVDPSVWRLQWTLNATQALALNLVDEHGLANSEPIAYRIEAVEDRQPAVTITQPQADETVLPTAVIPLSSEARDDVSLSSVGLRAQVQTGQAKMEDALAGPVAWEQTEQVDGANASIQKDLDLGALHVSQGDVVLVSGIAQDIFELNGAKHEPARSPVRRLRVIGEMDFATQLRRQLGAVRQNAIRLETLQGELQDDVIEDGVQPGMDRAQAQLGERIATQRASVEDIERMLQQNRLDDPQLSEILSQTQDLLDFAGRAANKAVEAIEKRQGGESASGPQDDGEPREGTRSESGDPKPREGRGEQQGSNQKNAGQQQDSKDATRQAGGEQQDDRSAKEADAERADDKAEPDDDANEAAAAKDRDDEFREAAEEDREVVEAQQEVRDELADLIKLLDRDEDTWVVKRQLEDLVEQQAELQNATGKLGQQTIGKRPEELTPQQQSELDRIAQKQRDLRDETRKLIEQMRDRADALEKVDPQSAESMRNAANQGEQRQVDREQDEAAQKVEQNQMSSATAKQQNAQEGLQEMHKTMGENKRAQAQQLIRQLASLIESIQRLITLQENEITALAMAEDTKNFAGLDRSMIRLNQNTQSVAGEARAAGQESRRIARALDRAADTQGAAVLALRAQPMNVQEARDAENRSLELLNEAKTLAEELQQKTEEDQVRKRREELIAAYRTFAEKQIALREQTMQLQGVTPLDRRQLVEARRYGSQQDEIRLGLNQLRDVTAEIMDSIIFNHVHRLIDTWSLAVTESLSAGNVNVDATDRQANIAESIGHLIKALEESTAPPEEFAKDQEQQQQNQGGGGQGQQPLIPPVAQLKLIQGLQEQVYNLTRDMDARQDLDAAQRRTRLRDIGQHQRELMELGQQILEDLQQQQQQRQAPPQLPEGQTPDPQPPDGTEPQQLPEPLPGDPELIAPEYEVIR